MESFYWRCSRDGGTLVIFGYPTVGPQLRKIGSLGGEPDTFSTMKWKKDLARKIRETNCLHRVIRCFNPFKRIIPHDFMEASIS